VSSKRLGDALFDEAPLQNLGSLVDLAWILLHSNAAIFLLALHVQLAQRKIRDERVIVGGDDKLLAEIGNNTHCSEFLEPFLGMVLCVPLVPAVLKTFTRAARTFGRRSLRATWTRASRRSKSRILSPALANSLTGRISNPNAKRRVVSPSPSPRRPDFKHNVPLRRDFQSTRHH
jgi:hypothetical protein